MTIKVISPGLATSVQDLGRPGYYHLGIPISGGMDRFALRAANMLVGNDEGAAVLETVFMGPELEFTRDATVAVTGADLPPKLDGDPREGWTSFAVKAGQVLSFDFLKSGARAYIAVNGGIDTPLALGSRSTCRLAGGVGRHVRLPAVDRCATLRGAVDAANRHERGRPGRRPRPRPDRSGGIGRGR